MFGRPSNDLLQGLQPRHARTQSQQRFGRQAGEQWIPGRDIGWIADDEIEAFGDSLAGRLASFEKHALAGAKALMNEVTLPPDTVFQHALSAFFTSTAHLGTRARGASLIARGLQRRSDTELRLGQAVAEYPVT